MTRQNRTALLVILSVVGGVIALVVLACAGWVIFAPRPGAGTSSATSSGGESSLPQTSIERFQGGTVDYWGPRLLDADDATSGSAAQVLRSMGDESLRWFLRGMKSGAPHVREYSVVWVSGFEKYPKVFEPVLIDLLRTESAPGLVHVIATRLSMIGTPAGKAAVESRLTQVKDPEAKKDLARTIDQWPKR